MYICNMINENLYYQIELTARKIRHYGQSVLIKHGIDITVEQWLVLNVINDNKGINQLRIGEILVKDKPTISRMVRSLLEKGYIEKVVSTEDLRQYSISISKEGEKLINIIFPVVEAIRLKGIESLTKTEKENLSILLLKIQKNIDT